MQFPFWWALCFPSQPCCSLQAPQSRMHCTVPIALREQVNQTIIPFAHCSRGTSITQKQVGHSTIPYAPSILLKRNNLASERTRTTTHSFRTTGTGRKNRVTWYCGAASKIIKVLHHECKWRTQEQVSPVTLPWYWLFNGEFLFDRQIKLEVTTPGKFSTRKPDLWRSTTQ